MGRHLAMVVLLALGCGAGGGEVDPRCEVLCVIDEPAVEGAGDVCNAASAELCRDECSARIADTSTLCASCLLEGACFAVSCDGDDGLELCDDDQCTIDGREGSCTYPIGDDAAREDCLREVSPRREVGCDTEYRAVAGCADSCDEPS